MEDRCPHFDVLKDVMDSSPSTRPLLTTEVSEFRDDIESDAEDAETTTNGGQEDSSGVVRLQASAEERPLTGRARRNIELIRPPRNRAAITSFAWNDFNAGYTKVKEQEQLSARKNHQEKLAMQREELHQTARLQERRIACVEEEAKDRIQLLQAQRDRETNSSQDRGIVAQDGVGPMPKAVER
ncbi:hypothetical protein GN244_ATG08604 [Phytophthora infestans]|uniref:Uncharacterized protein n=1 Tax=Phytophthora infestans TaxID=4787 RepID=A0A833T8M1_PHYIN|nr:hypothetical protein GN244_ATG08604 [Phytophthora infestans]